jgi:hypothetical protein
MTINEFESEVVNRFNLYLEDANVHTAVSMIIDDCEGLSEEAIECVLEDIIVPTVIVKFARHLNALDQIHGYEHTPSEEWSRFSKFEGINETGFELGPLSHPAMRRVLASFELGWLGGATGRCAEPSM